jgi:hypothetical protein
MLCRKARQNKRRTQASFLRPFSRFPALLFTCGGIPYGTGRRTAKRKQSGYAMFCCTLFCYTNNFTIQYNNIVAIMIFNTVLRVLNSLFIIDPNNVQIIFPVSCIENIKRENKINIGTLL